MSLPSLSLMAWTTLAQRSLRSQAFTLEQVLEVGGLVPFADKLQAGPGSIKGCGSLRQSRFWVQNLGPEQMAAFKLCSKPEIEFRPHCDSG